MAAGFLITRILLVFMLSELDYSSAFPRARRSVYPEAWQGVREKQQEGYGYGNRRPLQYIQALRQPHRKLQPNVHDQVQVKTWQKPQGSSLRVRSHAQIQNQPGLYHQTQSLYQPWSGVDTKWTPEMSPTQPPPQRNHPLSKPRSFELSLKVPLANVGHAHEVSKPSFQLSLSVHILPTTLSLKPSSSNGGYLANLQRPGSVGFVQNSYMEPAKPQSSSTQSGSEWIFLNSARTVQQQTEHQTYEPIHTKYTDGKLITLSPGHSSQHTTPIEQTSQGKIPTEQSQVFPKPPAPSSPIPQYPPLQSDNVHSGYYSAQINPTSNGKGQSGPTVLPDPTNVNLSPLQYERVQSGHYSADQVKPSGTYDQHQTWQPVGTQLTFASEQYNYGQFKPSFGQEQNVETEPHVSPVHPPSPTIASSQYELPFGYNREVATTNHYGTGNVVQMGQTDLSSSSPYQYSRGQSGQDALPDHLTAFDPSPNFQGLSTDYQNQMRLPGQYTGRGQLDGKPKYMKLFIDVEDTDGGDGQHNYFAAPPMHYDGYSHGRNTH